MARVHDISPPSPEKGPPRSLSGRALALVRRRGSAFYTVVKRVVVGVYSDGFIHAGNLAYLALLTLFPFFMVVAALAQFFGRGPDTLLAVHSFLRTLPPHVADLLRKPILDMLAARTGSLLWLGALAGMWTVGSFIETIRDILRRAYGAEYSRSFWHYRLGSAGLIIASVILALTAFSAQLFLTGVEQFINRLLPMKALEIGLWIGLSRIAPLLMLVAALYGLFYSLTPVRYRASKCPKWPGAVFTAFWWMAATMLLPPILARLGTYNLTYGSLAGVIITLLFFWMVGFGLVIGAHLNAALAETPQADVKEPPAQTRVET